MPYDGILTFESSYQALRAERVLQRSGIPVKMVPAPRELSPTCVVAIRFAWEDQQVLQQILTAQNVESDQCRFYPETAGRPAGWISL